MAIAKTEANFPNCTPGTTLAAGSALTNNTLSCATGYDVVVGVSIATGGTAPTGACNATVYGSVDNTNWYEVGYCPGAGVADTTNSYLFPVPAATSYVRVDFSAPSGANVTIGAQLGMMTSL